MTIRRLYGPTAPVLLAVTAMAAGCGGGHSATQASKPQAGLRGLAPTPPPHKPGFTLTDTTGRRFTFAGQTRTKLTYLYFGYTHCPDACPTTMSDLAVALRHQPAAVRHRIEVVFVTVDPRRDTPRVLRAWLNQFDRSFIGLTGTPREIGVAEQAAGLPLAPPEKHTGTNYAVQHSSLVLAYSPDNLAHVLYAQGFHSADYAHDMPLLLTY